MNVICWYKRRRERGDTRVSEDTYDVVLWIVGRSISVVDGVQLVLSSELFVGYYLVTLRGGF